MRKIPKKTLALGLVLALLLALSAGAAGGQGAAAMENRVVFKSAVCNLAPGQTEAAFTVMGYYPEVSADSDFAIKAFSPSAAAAVLTKDGLPAKGVSAACQDGTLTLRFDSPPAENAAYYIKITDGGITSYPSPVYVTAAASAGYLDGQAAGYFDLGDDGDPDTKDAFSLPMPSEVTANVNNPASIAPGGAQTLFDAEDFSDTKDLSPEVKEAVNWYLHGGITNGGDSSTEFAAHRVVDANPTDDIAPLDVGSNYLRAEAVHFLFRLYILDSELPDPAGVFTDVLDLANNNWANYYITDFTGLLPLMKTGFYLGDSVVDPASRFAASVTDRVAFGVDQAVNYGDFLNFIYNAVTLNLANLSDSGQALKNKLLAAAHGSRAERAEAVNQALGLSLDLGAALDTPVGKLDAVCILYKLKGTSRGLVSYPDASTAAKYGYDITAGANFAGGFYAGANAKISADTVVDGAGKGFIYASGKKLDENGNGDSYQYSGLWVSAGDVVLKNVSILSQAGTNNEKYRWGGGAGLMATGAGTLVRAVNTDGSISVKGAGTTMSGATYSGVGATVYYQNGQIFSGNQHTSNSCWGGTLIYDASTIMGGGRVVSTDHFGGNLVFYNTVANKTAGGMYVLDETASLLAVNSYFTGGGSANEINGMAQAAYVNCVLDKYGSVSFSNKTSMTTDTAGFTLVNTVMNMAGGTIASADRGGRAVMDIVDSTVTLASDTGYLFKVNGASMFSGAYLTVNAENSSLPAAGKVFVDEGDALYLNLKNSGTMDLTVDYQATSKYTQSMMGVTDYYASTGSVVLNGVPTGFDENGSPLSPDKVVQKGYSYTWTVDGSTVTYENVGAATETVYETTPDTAAVAAPVTGGGLAGPQTGGTAPETAVLVLSLLGLAAVGGRLKRRRK